MDDSGCPEYGSTNWQCLGDKLNCQGTRTYHCAKDQTGIWRETCAEMKICMIGELTLYALMDLGVHRLCGRVLDSRPRGRGLEPQQRHCLVSLSKTH